MSYTGESILRARLPTSETIGMLKHRISEAYGIPMFLQRLELLSYGVLDDYTSLEALDQVQCPVELLLIRMSLPDSIGVPAMAQKTFKALQSTGRESYEFWLLRRDLTALVESAMPELCGLVPPMPELEYHRWQCIHVVLLGSNCQAYIEKHGRPVPLHPDPRDITVPKRQWEMRMAQWRTALRRS